MGLEDYYFKLPDFIKYNPRVLKFGFNTSNSIKQRNGISPQDFLLEFSSKSSEFKEMYRKFKVLYIELLKFIDNVCKKHNIDYWLGYGTLLGAVRHGGFIPWDDDIDLVLLRSDYNKLIEVLPKEMSKYDLNNDCGITLLLENQKNYFKNFQSVFDIKDAEGNDLIQGKYNFLQFAWLKPSLKIDFFPYDFLEDGREDNIQSNYAPTQYKFYHDVLTGNVKFLDALDLVRQELGLTYEKTGKVAESMEVLPHWKIKIFDYDKIFPLDSIDFEGQKFNCPNDNDYVLTEVFGPNYMEFPKVIENHDTLELIEKQFDSKEEMNDAFDEAISFLKRINESFE